MLDIETLGTGSNSLVLSIGAVEFGLDGTTYRMFSVNLPVLEQIINPMVEVDIDTIKWWKSQSEEAKKALLSKKACKAVKEGLLLFYDFIKCFENPVIWGNGCTFDNVILRNLFKSFNLSFPVNFWSDMDVRTVVQLAGYEKVNQVTGKFEGTKHDAIADCLHQVKLVTNGYKLLRGDLK